MKGATIPTDLEGILTRISKDQLRLTRKYNWIVQRLRKLEINFEAYCERQRLYEK